MIKVILTVDGMKCGMCETHVNDCIRKAGEVKKVKSSHAKGRTEIVCDDGAEIERFVGAIAAQGYRVTDVSKEPYVKKGLFGRK